MSFVFQKGDRIGVQLMNNNNLMDVELFQSLYDTVVIGKTIDQVADRLQTAPHNIAASRLATGVHEKLAKLTKSLVDSYPQQHKKSEVMSVQHGGNHYKGMKIEPVDYAMENNLDCLQFSVVKYVTRHKLKGKAEDLKKCIHFAQMALEKCYGVKSSVEFEEPKKAGE